MHLANLGDTDRSIARVVRVLSVLVLSGLAVTGAWQFFFHEADSSWSGYELGSDRYPRPSSSTGIADAHGALADLAGLLGLFILAWLSGRVLHRVSWFAVGSLLLLVISLYTGSLIRYNATFEADTLITNAQGYGQFFGGSTDGAVVDGYELSRLSMVLWTLAHVLSIPMLIVALSITFKRSETRRQSRKEAWLENRRSH